MKFLKGLLVVLGVAALGFGVYVLVRLSWDMNKIMGAANAAKTIDNLSNPMPRIWIASGVAAVAGLLLGLGLGLPRRTAGSVRKETLRGAASDREAAIREAAIRRAPGEPQPSEESVEGAQR